ncbi:hypothetical protein RXV94_04850 [Yeosuana sp. MJ-SS3]|uniref:Uncharacterized protein n=1 Tax=Gilvirhabdus luticola TaxID=3079858 RepID=A0ABU3U5S6_9FLAO|nr:hypothetical protein [Yeosuana sp. MJ-SS3]MDU8885480.1 hypothetical protein [Yeosuana sp. MJ-SS3]
MTQLLRQLLLFSLLILITVAVYNIVIDPYGVIRGDMSKQFTTPNERYLKVKHVIQNPNLYNSYFFGSSRVSFINTKKINDNNTWYNLSYSAGVPGDFLYDLKTMKKNGVCIENLVIGIDDLSYYIDPQIHLTQDLRKPFKNRFNPLIEYISLIPSIEFIKTRELRKKLRFQGFYDIYDSGVSHFLGKDGWIERHPEAHINDPKFLVPKWDEDLYKSRIEPALDEIKAIILICKQENIDLTFFFTPLHVQTYLKQHFKDYSEFLLQLSQLTSFYDFSGINAITIDNYNYYETSHFRPFIGDMMLDRLFREERSEFGVLVTSETIDSVILQKQKDITEYKLKNKTPYN